ncbi:MAG: beta strand repeat-containing protein, partial [Paracoccaceae bacterium]
GGLTVDADLTVASGQNRAAYLELEGEQTLDGTGTILLSDENAPIGSFSNNVIFDGVLSASETLTVSEDITILGEGRVYAQDSGDDILLEGTIVADDGQLIVEDLQELEGILGATSDGELDINTNLTLTERGTLAVGVAGSGAEASAGRIDHNSGVMTLEGTLALDVADDFAGALGDSFDIITSRNGFAGSFDGFEGFDLEGNLAFKLVQTLPDTLSIQVTTDTEAAALGFIGRTFTPTPKVPFERVDVALDDVAGRVVDANIIADRTGPGAAITAYENVVFKADVTDEALLSNRVVAIEQGASLDGVTVSLGGSSLASYTLDVNGDQTWGGTGNIVFSTFDLDTGRGPRDFIRFDGVLSGVREVLTIEEGITLQGDVSLVATNAIEDRIKFLGTLVGTEGGFLSLAGVDNMGGSFAVDASEGIVGLYSRISNATVEAASTNTGQLQLYNSTVVQNVTLSIDTLLDASGGNSVDVDFVDGLALDDITLTLAGFNNQAMLDFQGAQQVTGTGTILMAENSAGPTNNDIRFDGFESFAEILTFGSDITIRGNGVIDALDAGDSISILGSLVGEGSGRLSVFDLDNAGGTVTVDASLGRVGFGSGIANATIDAATGNTGAIELFNSGGLRNVTLGIDTRMDAELFSLSATVRDGLTLSGSTFTLAGSEFASAALTFFGEQTLDGTGTLLLSDENAIDGRGVTNNNQVLFTGVDGGQETFRIADGVMLEGSGRVDVSAGDLLELDGDVTARGGRLFLEGVEEVEGELTATAGAILDFDRTLGLTSEAGLTIGLGGAGRDLTAGLLDVNGLLQRGGTFSFDLTADFDAEIGTEFEVLRTTQGFTDSFASVQNATIDAARGLALVEDGNSLYARVVATAQIGQQLTRADLPAAALVPVLNQNLTGQSIDQSFLDGLARLVSSETADAFVSGGIWRSVDLGVDAIVQTGRQLNVYEGLTVDGSLSVEGSGRVYFYGAQTIDGVGSFVLEQGGSSWFYLVGQDSSATEVVTFGADLTLEGQGYMTVQRTEDRFQILGDVIGVGGELLLNYIDNAGEVLSLDSAGGGWVKLQTAISNAVVDVAADANVQVVSSQLSEVSLGGAGTTRIQSATVSGLTVEGQAEIEGVVASATATLTVTDDLTVNGELALSGTNGRYAYLYLNGDQTVEGDGEIFLSRNNAIGEESVLNWVQLRSRLSNEREDLVFGEDLTLRGTGTVTVNAAEDRLQILGDVKGEGGTLTLRYIDNQGEVLTVDPGAGLVRFGTLLEDAVVTAAGGTSGYVGFENGAFVRDTILNVDARLEAATNANIIAYFEDAVTLNGDFELVSQASRYAYLYVNGAQTLDGTGTIDLSRANLNPGQSGDNRIIFEGDLNGTAETLTFGADLELKGDGLVYANDAEDSLQILGQVTGVADQTLVLRDVNNAGGALNIDATEGTVLIGDRIIDTVITGIGEIGFEASARLNDVTLSMDAAFGSSTSNPYLYVSGGLTVDADLTVASGQNRAAYLELEGEQTLDGTGTILLSDENAPIGS